MIKFTSLSFFIVHSQMSQNHNFLNLNLQFFRSEPLMVTRSFESGVSKQRNILDLQDSVPPEPELHKPALQCLILPKKRKEKDLIRAKWDLPETATGLTRNPSNQWPSSCNVLFVHKEAHWTHKTPAAQHVAWNIHPLFKAQVAVRPQQPSDNFTFQHETHLK